MGYASQKQDSDPMLCLRVEQYCGTDDATPPVQVRDLPRTIMRTMRGVVTDRPTNSRRNIRRLPQAACPTVEDHRKGKVRK